MKPKPLAWIGPVVGIVLFSVAIWILHRELAAHHFRDIVHQIGAIPAGRIAAALALTAAGYGAMTLYDLLALRYLGQSLAYFRIALAAFIGAAFSNNIGLSMLAGASVRYRLYSAWGLSALEITKLVFFCSLTVWLGFLSLAGMIFIIEPLSLPAGFSLPVFSTRLLGTLLTMGAVAYLAVGVLWRRPLRLRDWQIDLPPWRTRLLQTLVGSADWLLAGSVLVVLLPPAKGLSPFMLLAMVMLAQLAGLASQVPGGLGVFETVFLLLVGGSIPAETVMGALFAFRITYYLLPLAIGVLLLAGNEAVLHRESARRVMENYRRWSAPVVPPVLAFTTFAAGAVLLFSGATPELGPRLEWLTDVVPLTLLEVSHFVGSAIGMTLLLLARGIQRRLNGAYWVCLILLAIGVVASLVKGGDYEEALFLAVLLAALLPARRFFYRQSSLLNQRFTPAWVAAIAMVAVSALWLGFFTTRHVDYRSDLWWQFALSGHASRFLRASAGAAAVLLAFAVARLLRPPTPRPVEADVGQIETAAGIVLTADSTVANLALMGDKSFLFSPPRTPLSCTPCRVAAGSPWGIRWAPKALGRS